MYLHVSYIERLYRDINTIVYFYFYMKSCVLSVHITVYAGVVLDLI